MRTNSSNKWHALVFIGLVLAIGALTDFESRQSTQEESLVRKPVLNSIAAGRTSAAQPATNAQTAIVRKVLPVDEADFFRLVLQAECPVLVDFHTQWCVPCRKLAPVLEELAAETAHARIVSVNVDDCPNLALEYNIRRIPTLKVFRGGQVAGEFIGITDKSRLQALLK